MVQTVHVDLGKSDPRDRSEIKVWEMHCVQKCRIPTSSSNEFEDLNVRVEKMEMAFRLSLNLHIKVYFLLNHIKVLL